MPTNYLPKVSIVIPVYNREELVKKAIESAINQTYQNIEIIIIDNNSNDKTYDVVKSYELNNKQIKVFKNDENIGPVNNWIEGIKKASGEYIKILFSDDWISGDYIEKTVIHFDENVGLIFTPAIIHKIKGDRYYYKLYNTTRSIKSAVFLNLMLLTCKTPLSPGCGMFRKDDVLHSLELKIDSQKHNEYLKYGAGLDVLIYLTIAEKYDRIVFVHDTYAHFLQHNSSFTYANSLNVYYVNAFKYFLKSTKKIKFKFFYLMIYNFRIHKLIGFLSNMTIG
jgi:glycosyltransferase involved in cell wall biosynthesis